MVNRQYLSVPVRGCLFENRRQYLKLELFSTYNYIIQYNNIQEHDELNRKIIILNQSKWLKEVKCLFKQITVFRKIYKVKSCILAPDRRCNSEVG